MEIVKTKSFDDKHSIIFGVSNTSIEEEYNSRFSEEELKKIQRENFIAFLGINKSSAAYLKQVHGDQIIYVTESGFAGIGDAMVTDKNNIALIISTADCIPILLFDMDKKISAAVHSGWRGTEKEILRKTIIEMKHKFGSNASNIIAYIGPSICAQHYEVDEPVALRFNGKYLKASGTKFKLDLKKANLDMLIEEGVQPINIDVSSECTFENKLFNSYRRDGIKAGRCFNVICFVNKEF